MEENKELLLSDNGAMEERAQTMSDNGAMEERAQTMSDNGAMEEHAQTFGSGNLEEHAVVELKHYRERKKFFTTRNMTLLAVFTAMSYVLYMFVKFPLPFIFPEFLDFQISDVPALLGGFMLNPLMGCMIVVLKCLLKLPFSSTIYVGELADALIGIAFVLPSSIIYSRFRTKKGALIGLGVGILSSVIMSLIANAIILIPFYVKIMFDGNWEFLLRMVRGIFSNVTKENFYSLYLPLSILPFNIIRCVLSALVTYLLYKKLEKLFSIIGVKVKSKKKSKLKKVNKKKKN